ncbi:MAG: DNA repair protein RadA/Sms [Maribacter sp.]|jgi:DNA repair protein RadA/Sms
MAKIKKVYICSNCGENSPKWAGKCSSCNEWNTFQEEIIAKGDVREEKKKVYRSSGKIREAPVPVVLPDIKSGKTQRIIAEDSELNRVLGGGIVTGSIVLLGGQPGIGKSTLLLQLAISLPIRILYVSGEESEEQIKMRADRIGTPASECYILTETGVDKIINHSDKLEPDLIIIDSIQTLVSPFIDSAPGSISQVRECANELQRYAKETNIPIFLIGHINKDGAIAGPKLLEHLVDVVLQFEGDRNYTYRILRTIKNRFGSTNEIGIYEMRADGLKEVPNPSEILLSQHEEILSGSAVSATLEGLRPMLIETQALVSTAVYGTPQRSATGFDLRRMSMLLAVLEKRCGIQFGASDVFLNIAGGIKSDDPALDLSVVAALISSLEDIAITNTTCFAGEVGLSGEIRSVNRIEKRIQEADRLGFEEIFISKYNTKGLDTSRYSIKVNTIGKVDELFEALFG